MFHSINVFQLRNFLFLAVLLPVLAGCGGGEPTPTEVVVAPTPRPIPTPVVGDIEVSEPLPISPGKTIGISVNVVSVPDVEINYQWARPEGKGEILDGQGTSAITYRTPTEPDTYKIGVQITAAGADAVFERSVFITVGEKLTAAPTPTPTKSPTVTATSIEPPVTDTSRLAITLSVSRNTATASGQVTGLDPDQYPAYKILVYLKTNIWFIQPVLGGFANIQANGSWRMTELKIIDGVPTTAYAYLARRDFQAPDQSSLEFQVDGVDVIARAEPVEVQSEATPTVPASSVCEATSGTATITLSVAGTTASGQVSGLDPAQYPACKVLVYLETDKFYIQPVLGGFANIQADGSWRMTELKIHSTAPTIAYAYLARRDFQAPDTSQQELEFDGVNIIARAEPVKVQ